jgi:transcriptional regulator with XRE-family HTH domain
VVICDGRAEQIFRTDIEVAIGKRIADLREKRGLTLSQLAKLVGMSKSALWAIEQGKVSSTISTLWKIANALGVTFGELVEPSLSVAENGVEVRLIERRDGKEVYIMRLGAGLCATRSLMKIRRLKLFT